MNRRRNTSRRTNTQKDSKLEQATLRLSKERHRADVIRARLEDLRPALESTLAEWGLAWGDMPPRRLIHNLSSQTLNPIHAVDGRFLEEYRVLLVRLRDAEERVMSASHLFRQSSTSRIKQSKEIHRVPSAKG